MGQAVETAELETPEERSATDVGQERTPEEQAEQENAVTVSSIKGELKSWERTLNDEQDPESVALLREGYDKMIDRWLDELADIDTEDSIELARVLNKTKDGIALQ